jgi:hypothetical protein
MLVRALEDGVQPPVAAQPGEGSFNHPADAGGNELSVSAARNGLDRDIECLTGLGQPLAPVAEVPQGWPRKPPSASSRRTGTMALVSWRFAGATSIARGVPYFSTAIWILTPRMPRIFLPQSMPRAKQLGAE